MAAQQTAEQKARTGDKVLYDVGEAGVATITLNDPDTRNALSPELLGGLIEAFRRARDDERVRCVVLASSHDKTFSSASRPMRRSCTGTSAPSASWPCSS